MNDKISVVIIWIILILFFWYLFSPKKENISENNSSFNNNCYMEGYKYGKAIINGSNAIISDSCKGTKESEVGIRTALNSKY